MTAREREPINTGTGKTGTDERSVRRNEDGTFGGSDDVGRSLPRDVRKHAKTGVKPGQGDHGDGKRES